MCLNLSRFGHLMCSFTLSSCLAAGVCAVLEGYLIILKLGLRCNTEYVLVLLCRHTIQSWNAFVNPSTDHADIVGYGNACFPARTFHTKGTYVPNFPEFEVLHGNTARH